VYSNNRFKGLLTENGITRWLAKHVERADSLVDVNDVFVSELLREEEQRDNCSFVSRDLETEILRIMFRDLEILEAVLITENGQRTEIPLGIATRWDMLQ
jgi:hypothetical protein